MLLATPEHHLHEDQMPAEIISPVRRRRLRRTEASKYLKEHHDYNCAPKTLAKLAVIGGGPEMVYAGRFPLYPEDALDEFVRSKLSPRVSSTSELRALQHSKVA